MFLGHWGVGFGAKRIAPRVSLGTLLLAAQWLDLLWPTLLLLGWEHVAFSRHPTPTMRLDFVDYPISHSLVAAIAWGFVVGGVYYALRRTWSAALVLVVLVPSHWILDLLVHEPDLPLVPGGGPRLGLRLWESLPWTVAVEIALIAIGVRLYVRSTRPRDRVGTWALVGLVVFLLAVYGASLAGPPPKSVTAIAWAGEAQWLLVLWGYWIDRHRMEALPVAAAPMTVEGG